MAAHRIEVDLFSMKSLEAFKKSLIDYKKSLPFRTEAFIQALADSGYTVARKAVSDSSHQMQNWITVEKPVVNRDETGCYAILRVIPTQILETEWYRSDEGEGVKKVTGTLNPALAVEFGTASKALPPQERFGGYGGQGTNSKGGNAERSSWWFARGIDDDGRPTDWKMGTAIEPTRPLHKAMLAMESEIVEIAKRYF